MKNLTLKQLVEERPDFVEAILNGEHNGTITTFVEKDKAGKVTKWTEEKRDIDGILVSKRVDDYTYCLNGDVDEISLKWYDKTGKLNIEKIVKSKDK